MFLYLFLGFIFGEMIPFMARRFGKLIPMDPGLLLLNLIHRPRFPKVKDSKRHKKLKKLWYRLWINSLLWGTFTAGLFFLCAYFLPTP